MLALNASATAKVTSQLNLKRKAMLGAQRQSHAIVYYGKHDPFKEHVFLNQFTRNSALQAFNKAQAIHSIPENVSTFLTFDCFNEHR